MPAKNPIRKVLLINPPAIVKESWADDVGSFPLGLSYIAAVLEQNGSEVKIIDCFTEGFFERTSSSFLKTTT